MAADIPSTMKAVQWTSSSGGIEKHMRVNDVSPPTGPLPKDSALVRVSYATLNPVDYKFAETLLVGNFITRTPGSDFAGTVVSSNHSDIKSGDAVFGIIEPPSFGALAEYVIVRGRKSISKLPASVNPRDAAALGVVALTAYQSIVPFVGSGDRVFINGGSGGVGTFGIQLAKLIGCHVTVTCSGPNVELCRNLGADEVIDYRTTDPVVHLKRQGTQYKLIFDTVGTPALYYSAHHYLKPDGSFNTIAADPTSFASIWETALMFILPGFVGGGRRKLRFTAAAPDVEVFARLVQWLQEGKLKTHVDTEYAIDQAAEAFAKLKTGRTRGKIIVKIN